MLDLLDSPFAPTVLWCAAVAVVFTVAAIASRSQVLADLSLPATFLAAYYETYQKIPGFPPVGSTNKIFYAALLATALGLALDLARLAALRWVAVGTVSVLIAVWIALPRFADADLGLLALVVALALGGGLILWRLLAVAAGPAPDQGPLVAAALLAVLSGVFAPIALFGGSSTSVGLCLGLAVGVALAAAGRLIAPLGLRLAAVLGAGGGLLAVIDTVTLITRRADLLALAVMLAVLVAGQTAARLILPAGRPGPRLRSIAVALLAASPIVVVIGLLLLRNENPLGN